MHGCLEHDKDLRICHMRDSGTETFAKELLPCYKIESFKWNLKNFYMISKWAFLSEKLMISVLECVAKISHISLITCHWNSHNTFDENVYIPTTKPINLFVPKWNKKIPIAFGPHLLTEYDFTSGLGCRHEQWTRRLFQAAAQGTIPTRSGHISKSDYYVMIKMTSLLLKKWHTDLSTIQHTSRQVSCQDMCKIVAWLRSKNQIQSRKLFHKFSSPNSYTICEMVAWIHPRP